MGNHDPESPLKSYEINGWVISKNGEIWQAVNKKTGLVGRAEKTRIYIDAFARTTIAR